MSVSSPESDKKNCPFLKSCINDAIKIYSDDLFLYIEMGVPMNFNHLESWDLPIFLDET